MQNLIELNFASRKFKTAARIAPQQECPAICAAPWNFVQHSGDLRSVIAIRTMSLGDPQKILRLSRVVPRKQSAKVL